MLKLKIHEDYSRYRIDLEVEFDGTEEELKALIESEEHEDDYYSKLPGIKIINKREFDREIGYELIELVDGKTIAER